LEENRVSTEPPCPWCGNIIPGTDPAFCYKNPHAADNWLAKERAEKARLDRENNVITDLSELSGWEIMELRRHKPGVVRWAAERNKLPTQYSPNGRERREGYAKDEVFARLQIREVGL
jgi:hypothetical protein